MKYAYKEECEAAGLDPEKVNSLARRFSALSLEAKKMGLTIFGGAGHGTFRINDKPGDAYSRPLIVAQCPRPLRCRCGSCEVCGHQKHMAIHCGVIGNPTKPYGHVFVQRSR